MTRDTPPLNRHPFFRPLWRRLLVVALAFGWTAVEVAAGSTTWAMLFGAMGAYAAWQFFVAWKGDEPPP